MKTRKVNVGLSISRNFNKVTLEMMDEPIEAETDEQLVEGIRKKFELLEAEIKRELSRI